jgi:beta-glucanase (GH16 family)
MSFYYLFRNRSCCFIVTALTLLLAISTFSATAQCPSLVWSDEFNGSSLDQNKWSYQIGDGCAEGICGWGNNELQYYQESNVTVSNGQLHITAKKERVRAKSYTSGRIRTINKGDWTYGRFEARIKLPAGRGLWPAFWMLPTDEVYGGWPRSGEIDIMEYVGADPTHVLGTIHYGDAYPNNRFQGGKFDLYTGTFPEAFHDFAIEWENGVIRWFVDDILYLTKNAADISPYHWPFDQRFHFLLNVAVGGNLGGSVDDSIFPQTMDVEYVRVYNGFKPYISGKRLVSNRESNVTYSVGNLANNITVNWTVPSGATIVSGQGTSSVTVSFGNASGNVLATFTNSCGSQQLVIPVVVEPAYVKDFSFENFDEPAIVTLGTYTGVYSEVPNPAPGGVNTSAISGKYIRNSSQQYDVLTYNISTLGDANVYADRINKFYMDVYTSAPVGTEILLQLETSTATSSNYPSGRHSRYVATVTAQNQWQRLAFSFLDRPDGGASPTGIVRMILLFASNTFTGDTYYYDNLDSYVPETGNVAPTVAITSPSEGSVFNSGSVVAINATASDSDGSVAKVEFFANGTSIGTDFSSPYTVNWTIGTGSYSLTARATDNSGATTTSAPVNVSGSGTSASYMYVAAVSTSTVSAGGNNKYGVATVAIRDNNGSAVPSATVTGTFSGSFNETRSGVTNSDGVATIQTSGKVRGTVTVNFCVTQVTHSVLPYNAEANLSTCSGDNAGTSAAGDTRQARQVQTGEMAHVDTYPNPFTGDFKILLSLVEQSTVEIVILDGAGRSHWHHSPVSLAAGEHTFDVIATDFPRGLYLVKTIINGRHTTLKQIAGK